MAHDAPRQRSTALRPSDDALPSRIQPYVADHHDDAAYLAVLVHGGMDRARSFARLARRLDGAHVVSYDRRGYGASRGAAPRAGLDVQVDDLRDVVAWATRTMGDRPVVVVGHSYGGLIALAGGREPVPVGDMVVAYEPPFPWHPQSRDAERPPISDDGALEAERFVRRLAGDSAWTRLDPTERAEREADGLALLEDLRTLRGGPALDPGDVVLPATVSIGERADERHRLMARALVDRLPVARLTVVEGAGHGAHLASPQHLAEAVRDAVEWAVSLRDGVTR